MAEKLTPAFQTRDAAETTGKPSADDIGKKKLYCVSLPTPEAYAAFVKTHGTTMWMWTDGYASSAYTAVRYAGGEVSVAPKDRVAVTQAIAAEKAAREAAEEAARKAAADAESTRQMMARMQAEMEAMKASIAAQAAANGEPTTAGANRRNRNS